MSNTGLEGRWAVNRTGGVGHRTVGDLRPCDTADVVAVASRSRDTAGAFAKDWGVPHIYEDDATLRCAEQQDAVS